MPPESGARILMILVMSVMLAQVSAEWASIFSAFGVSVKAPKRYLQEAPGPTVPTGPEREKIYIYRISSGRRIQFTHSTACDARPATHKWGQTEVAPWIPGTGNIAADRRGKAVHSNRHA